MSLCTAMWCIVYMCTVQTIIDERTKDVERKLRTIFQMRNETFSSRKENIQFLPTLKINSDEIDLGNFSPKFKLSSGKIFSSSHRQIECKNKILFSLTPFLSHVGLYIEHFVTWIINVIVEIKRNEKKTNQNPPVLPSVVSQYGAKEKDSRRSAGVVPKYIDVFTVQLCGIEIPNSHELNLECDMNLEYHMLRCIYIQNRNRVFSWAKILKYCIPHKQMRVKSYKCVYWCMYIPMLNKKRLILYTQPENHTLHIRSHISNFLRAFSLCFVIYPPWVCWNFRSRQKHFSPLCIFTIISFFFERESLQLCTPGALLHNSLPHRVHVKNVFSVWVNH